MRRPKAETPRLSAGVPAETFYLPHGPVLLHFRKGLRFTADAELRKRLEAAGLAVKWEDNGDL